MSATAAAKYDRLSKSMLSEMFRLDRRTVDRYLRTHNVEPTERNGCGMLYSLRDAAPALVRAYDETLAQAGTEQKESVLDRKLRLEADRLELKLKEEQGLVVDVADAAETISEILKIINTSLRGFGHALEAQHGFTADQAAILEQCLDTARRELAEQLRAQLQALHDQAEQAAVDSQ